jgi:predicted TIM-barrel fold metal-dependent hydrolase
MPCSTIIRTRRRPAARAGKSGTPAESMIGRHRSRPRRQVNETRVVERSTAELREVVQRLAKHDLTVSLELKAAVGMLYQVARLSELATEHGNSAAAVSHLGAVTVHLESVCTQWCAG